MKISIIIPVLNEVNNIRPLLESLAVYREQGHEVIVVDGGSGDNTMAIAQSLCDLCIHAQQGRATQMNAGARCASGDVLVFLHADVRLPENALQLMSDALQTHARWGFFQVSLDGRHPLFRIIETMMNFRSCLTSIATGDQALFVKKDVFTENGGYPEQALMEDIELSGRLRKHGSAVCIKSKVSVSSRRWQQHGIIKTVLLMWLLRLQYFFGASPDYLVRKYYA